mgnify:CR=1 FL=1
MKNLLLVSQSKKGGNPISDRSRGYVKVEIVDDVNFKRTDMIEIDNFDGYGKNYKQREEPQIKIISDGELLFTGTIQELSNKLK